jgi:2-C-methyl-D-erythritol 4-phosphate cytidylyltransferase
MAIFSVVLLTAPPSSSDSVGAFVKVDGRECLLRSVELFLNRDNIKQIQLVVAEEGMEEAKRKFGGHLAFSGVKLLAGGPRWVDQIAAIGQRIAPECSHVIVHDAARPAVAYSDIDNLMAEAEKHAIVALTAPLRAAVAEVDAANKPLAFHPASKFMQILTPWCYSKDKFIHMAENRAEPEAGGVTLFRGSSLNLRVNAASDAGMIKTMIGMLPKPKMRALDNPFEEAQW